MHRELPACIVADLFHKLVLYARAASTLRSLNITGLPLLPKKLFPNAPYNRAAYNTFVLWIKELGLSKVGRVFDVGANHGDFSRAASAFFPLGHVWLFEPLPALWPKLERQAARRADRWSVQPFALGAAAGRLPLQVSTGDDSIGSFVGFDENYLSANPSAAVAESIDSRIETLDEFCARENIDTIDLLKIDVEGFEFDVLAGARRMLARTRALIIEVSLIRQARGQSEPLLQMLELLVRMGFHVVDLIPSFFARGEEPWKPIEYNLLARRSGVGHSLL